VRRHFAKAVSHKLCQTAALYSNLNPASFQSYHASTHTVSTVASFENNRSVSIVIIAASVKHNKDGSALFEAIVWTEIDGVCGTDDVFLLHCVGHQLALAPICEVAGSTVSAVVTQHTVQERFQEAVISCVFRSELFRRNISDVLVKLSDASKAFSIALPMCSLAANTPVRKLMACSQPIYNAQLLEKLWPGVLRAWVLYHVIRAALAC
jgi:hypothetical protein